MGLVPEKDNTVDVICMHGKDGSIIPIKLRVIDEDGAYQTYMIRGYKDISSNKMYAMPNGINASGHIWRFECRIKVFDTEKRIVLLYNAYENLWRILR